jgi:NADH:ubiquinone oxidoreductase subunit C
MLAPTSNIPRKESIVTHEENITPEAAAQLSTPNPIDTTNISVPTGSNEEVLSSSNASAGTAQFVQVPTEVYAQFMRDIRESQITKKVKAMGIDYTNRRNTLIIRKATKLYPDIVTDEEVVAYYDLYKMRDAVQGEGKKVVVTDEETEAYIELWTGADTPSLEAVENLIAKKSI